MAHSSNQLAAAVRRRVDMHSRCLPPPSERLALRRSSKLSLQEIADLIGTTAVSVGRWESGDRTPRGAFFERYATVLDTLKGLQ